MTGNRKLLIKQFASLSCSTCIYTQALGSSRTTDLILAMLQLMAPPSTEVPCGALLLALQLVELQACSCKQRLSRPEVLMTLLQLVEALPPCLAVQVNAALLLQQLCKGGLLQIPNIHRVSVAAHIARLLLGAEQAMCAVNMAGAPDNNTGHMSNMPAEREMHGQQHRARLGTTPLSGNSSSGEGADTTTLSGSHSSTLNSQTMLLAPEVVGPLRACLMSLLQDTSTCDEVSLEI